MIPQQVTWASSLGQTNAKGGRIWLTVDQRPSASPAPRVSIVGPDGTSYVSNQTATLEGPSTAPTLDGIHKAGDGAEPDNPVKVSATTSITARMRLLIGSPSDGRAIEAVRVRSVLSSTTLSLWGPLLHDHDSGDQVSGCRLYYDVAGDAMTRLFRGGWAYWDWSTDGANLNRFDQTAIDCVRHPQRMAASEDDLRRVDSEVWRRLAARRDPMEVLEEGWDEVGRTLVSKGVWGFIHNGALARPTALLGLAMEATNWGEGWKERADRWAEEGRRVLGQIVEANPSDMDEDGTVTSIEQPHPFSTVRFYRAS